MYRPADLTTLRIGERPEFNIYGSSNGGQCLLSVDAILTQDVLNKLILWEAQNGNAYCRIDEHASISHTPKGLLACSQELFDLGLDIPPVYDSSVAINLRETLKNDAGVAARLTQMTCDEFDGEVDRGRIFRGSLDVLASSIESLYSQMSSARKKANLSDLKRSIGGFVRSALSNTFFYPDPLAYSALLKGTQGDFTYIHSLNVAKWAVAIGAEMDIQNRLRKITEQTKKGLQIASINLEEIALAAMLHDAGKLDPEVQPLIYAPRKLTNEELEVIRSHPFLGHQVLKPFQRLVGSNVMASVLEHHEKYGGQGYPFQINHLAINQSAAIICVADCFEAICFRKLYRPDLIDKEQVLDVLVQEVYKNRTAEFLKRFEKSGVRYTQADWNEDKFYAPLVSLFNITQNDLTYQGKTH